MSETPKWSADEPRLIDQDQAVVGEDEQIAEELETLPDDFARNEHGREFLLNLRDVDLRGGLKALFSCYMRSMSSGPNSAENTS